MVKIFSLILVAVFIATKVHSQEILIANIKEDESYFFIKNNPEEINEIIVEHSDHQRLLALQKNLQSWKQAIEEKVSGSTLPLRMSSGRHRLNISPLLPLRMKKLLQLSQTPLDGPNCYSSVMTMTQNIPIKYTDNSRLFLQKFCYQLEHSTPLQAGDIGSIEKGYPQSKIWNHESVHLFIYLDNQLVFTKNGPDKNEPYKLSSMQELVDIFAVDKNPQCYQPKNREEGNSCDRFLTFYRCEYQKEGYQDGHNIFSILNQLTQKAYLQELQGREEFELLYIYGKLAYELTENPNHYDRYERCNLNDVSKLFTYHKAALPQLRSTLDSYDNRPFHLILRDIVELVYRNCVSSDEYNLTTHPYNLNYPDKSAWKNLQDSLFR